jgi:RNA polymerase sigma factor (sigma-70 family)
MAARSMRGKADMSSDRSDATRPSDAWFATTRWTVVLSAGDPDSPAATTALETLCRAYWYPLYAYVRRRGHSPTDAQDLTQEFFSQLLEHHWVARADPHKGRFRSFLLMAMKRFLANEWDKAKTVKRGGRVQRISLSLEAAETRYLQEPVDTSTPEQGFEKRWAVELLKSVLGHLREDYVRGGKAALFDTLKPCLLGSRESQPYAAVAAELEMTEGAVKAAVCRLRERYRGRLREEIAHTVASPAEVEEELRHLFRVLARP